MSKPIFIGIAGGTASGKTKVAEKITSFFGDGKVSLIKQDAYYKEFKNLSTDERAQLNFDHPNAFDMELMLQDLNQLGSNKPITQYEYDYAAHTRSDKYTIIKPTKVMVVEGILLLAISELREKLDLKIFIDTDSDERLIRRLHRDLEERGRSFSCVSDQYLKTVKPMHLEFVEPSKRYADIIIPRGVSNKKAIDTVISRLHIMSEETE